MKKFLLVFLTIFLVLFVSCVDKQSYLLNNENFFTISENGAVGLSENGRISINALYSHSSDTFSFYSSTEITCTVEIPKTIKGIQVVEIAENGFRDFYCDQIKLPTSVVKIGKNAFRNSTIGKIELPLSVATIENYAFYGFRTNSILTIKKNVEKIGCFAFYGIKDFSLDPSNNFFKIVDGFLLSADGTKLLFQTEDKSNTSFTLPDTVQTIEEGSFINGEKVTIPVSVKEIKSYAFCSPKELKYDGSVSDFEEILLSEYWSYKNKTNCVNCSDGIFIIKNSVDFDNLNNLNNYVL